tara:strand:- start:721 stop:1632 length:912 start_codon:yes stop_codon:yes gene_type:complete
MKIYTKIVLDKDNNIIEEQSYDYTGPIAYCGGGGSAGDAGSSSQEATAPEDYYTSTDLVDSSVSIDEFATSPSNNTSTTSTTDFDDYPSLDNEEQQARDAETSTRNDTTYDAGGQDPGVPSPYTNIGTKSTSYINPNDTGSNLVNNIRANIASDTSTVTGTLGTVTKVLSNPINFIVGQSIKGAYQTAKFNREMGRPMTQGILDTGGLVTTGTDNVTLQDTMDNIRDAGSNIQTRTVDTASTGLPEPSKFLSNFVGSKSYIQDLYKDVKGILNTPRSTQGLLAVSDSPYYDFLKSRNLDRRIL